MSHKTASVPLSMALQAGPGADMETDRGNPVFAVFEARPALPEEQPEATKMKQRTKTIDRRRIAISRLFSFLCEHYIPFFPKEKRL